MSHTVLLLPGDGIGPEVIGAARSVLIELRPDIEYVEQPVGIAALTTIGRPYLPDLLETAAASAAILMGAVGGEQAVATPWDLRPEAALFALRQGLDLYANIRPVRFISALTNHVPLRTEVVHGTDLVIVRELVGGAYFGAKGLRDDGTAYDTFEYSESTIERVVRRAFDLATSRRGRLTSVDKANILQTSRLWRSVVERVADEYPRIECDHLLVDNAAMQLIRRPATFDVIVTENLFGDILSDEAAALIGGIGLVPSASLGTSSVGLFEPVHGSAPDIAGRGCANPTAALLSAAMMLRYSLNDDDSAGRLERALDQTFEEGIRTIDLGGTHNTTEFTSAVMANLNSSRAAVADG